MGRKPDRKMTTTKTHSGSRTGLQKLLLNALVLTAAALIYAGTNTAGAAILIFENLEMAYNAKLMELGKTPTFIDLDAEAPGTDLAGMTRNGVTFSNPDGNSLDVVVAANTFTTPGGFTVPGTGSINEATNVLTATTGANIISPGGNELVPGPALGQEDSLQLDFTTPVSSFAVEILYQSLDGAAFMSFELFDSAMNQLATGTFAILGDWTDVKDGDVADPGGAHFVGFVADGPTAPIARAIFHEFDRNSGFPDANVGYDALRITTPVPAAVLLFVSALAAVGGLGRRRISSAT